MAVQQAKMISSCFCLQILLIVIVFALASAKQCDAHPRQMRSFRVPTYTSVVGSKKRFFTTKRIPLAFASLDTIADESFLWGIRLTSALTSYFGFLGYLDRPQGYLMDHADEYLEVKQSTVPGAGLGLFAKETIPKNTVLGTYPGVVIPLGQNLGKLAKHPQCEGYIWRFSDNKMVIDPTNGEGILDSMSRGGNPSLPLSMELHKLLNLQVPTTLCRINEPPLGRDVNVVTDEDREKRQVVFSLERDVYAGEEIFIDYGLSYDRSMYGGGSAGGS